MPPGKYFVNPEISKGWKVSQSMLRYSPAFRDIGYAVYDDELDLSKGVPLDLKPGKHNGIDFYFDIDTAIRGKVLSPDGKPMKDVCVKAVSTELKEGDYRGHFDCTNKEGIFLIDRIQPGKYILVANDEGKISAIEPFQTLFYPNVSKYSEAKSFEIKLGDHLDGFTIQVSKIEELVTISGKLIYSNGVPIADESLKFRINENLKDIDGEQNIRTDDKGNFSFRILKGFEGSLFGDVYFVESMFKSCSQLYDEVKKRNGGKLSGTLVTENVTIDATKDVSNLIVKFDFPGCKKVE